MASAQVSGLICNFFKKRNFIPFFLTFWYQSVDPENNPTPPDLENIAIQPLGDKETWYQEHIQGCVDFYGEKGTRCVDNERERIDMNLRQPQSMRVSELSFLFFIQFCPCSSIQLLPRITQLCSLDYLSFEELYKIRLYKDSCPR